MIRIMERGKWATGRTGIAVVGAHGVLRIAIILPVLPVTPVAFKKEKPASREAGFHESSLLVDLT